MFKRIVITLINILFPPVGVCLLCGVGEDLFINSILFLCAIIPSHIHAFYVSLTYFARKRKIRKGIYPGKWKRMIYSERVQNGGASNREVERLRLEQQQPSTLEKVSSRMSGNSKRSASRKRQSRIQNAPTSPTGVVGQRGSQRYSGVHGQEEPSRRSSRRVAY